MTALLIGAVVSKPPTKRHSSRRRPGHLAGSLSEATSDRSLRGINKRADKVMTTGGESLV